MEEKNNFQCISELGDGYYAGIMSGCILDYDGKKYMCSVGVRGRNIPMVIKVEDGEDSFAD